MSLRQVTLAGMEEEVSFVGIFFTCVEMGQKLQEIIHSNASTQVNVRSLNANTFPEEFVPSCPLPTIKFGQGSIIATLAIVA